MSKWVDTPNSANGLGRALKRSAVQLLRQKPSDVEVFSHAEGAFQETTLRMGIACQLGQACAGHPVWLVCGDLFAFQGSKGRFRCTYVACVEQSGCTRNRNTD